MTICITPTDWVTNREPLELAQYTFKRVWRTTFKRALLFTKLHPNDAPSSTKLHPPPTSSFQPPPSSFQPPPVSLQHPQQYSNQNITRNWAISPNLDQKIQSCPFLLKIGSKGMLEVLIPNPDFDFWNCDLKIHFWTHLGSKSQNCQFCLKIGTHGISRMLIPIPTLVFWTFNSKFLFRQTWAKKSQSCLFCLKIDTRGIFWKLVLIPGLVFWVPRSKFIFGQN